MFKTYVHSISQIQLAYGVPMHVPFPYFYSPNGSKGHHFPSTLSNSSQISNNDVKSNIRRGTTSPENSSSPINFSSTIQNTTFNNHLNKMNRSRSVSNEDKIRDHPDDDNIEVD